MSPCRAYPPPVWFDLEDRGGLCPHLPWRRGACSVPLPQGGLSDEWYFLIWSMETAIEGLRFSGKARGLVTQPDMFLEIPLARFSIHCLHDECWQKLLSLIVSPDRDPWQGFWSSWNYLGKLGATDGKCNQHSFFWHMSFHSLSPTSPLNQAKFWQCHFGIYNFPGLIGLIVQWKELRSWDGLLY